MNRHSGILNALGAALLFGGSTPLAKVALSSVSPLLVAGLLYLGSGIGLAILRLILATTGKGRIEAPLARSDTPWLAGAILAGGVAGPIFSPSARDFLPQALLSA
jgi:drug/metabolite transporter (DMT)-like permease